MLKARLRGARVLATKHVQRLRAHRAWPPCKHSLVRTPCFRPATAREPRPSRRGRGRVDAQLEQVAEHLAFAPVIVFAAKEQKRADRVPRGARYMR